MIGWIIAFGIIVLVILLLICPVLIVFHLDEKDTHIYLRFCLFFKIDFVVNGKNTIEKRKKKSKSKNDKKPKKSLSEKMEQFSNFVRLTAEALKLFCKYFKMYRCRAHILIGGEDPADIAVEFGLVNAAVYGIISFLDDKITILHKDIQIGYDYDKDKITANVDFRFRISLIKFLIVLIYKYYCGILKKEN